MKLDYSVNFDTPCVDRDGEHIKVYVNGVYVGRLALMNGMASFRVQERRPSIRVMKGRFPMRFESLEAVMLSDHAVRTIAASAISNV